MPYCVHCGREVAADAPSCPTCGRPTVHPAAPAAPAPARSSSPAWWLVLALGCFGLLFVGGIVAALVIPNFLEALQKAKTKRTLADLQTVAAELEAYREEHGGVPAAGSAEELLAELDPDGTLGLPRLDGWKNPLRYECVAAGGPTGCASYRLASAGRDGSWEADTLAELPAAPFPSGEYDRDIVLADGEIVRHPDV